jgi:outer membrane protein TolC
MGTDMKKQVFIIFLTMVLATSSAYGVKQEKEKAETEPTGTLQLTVEDCIKLVLKQNLLLLDARLNPQISNTEIGKAKGEFDPFWEGRGAKNRDVRKPASLFSADVNQNEEVEFDTGFRQKLQTGTQWSLRFDNTYKETNSGFQTLQKRYETELVISVVQPLLKDFGMEVNEMGITIAANNEKISIEELKKALLDQMVIVEKVYWNLVFSIENLEVSKILLQQAEDLRKLNQAQVEAGVLAPIEVLEAEASVASRQEGVLVAENQIRDIQDRLLRITNLAEENWVLIPLPTDKAEFADVELDLGNSISDAIQLRPESKQAGLLLKNANHTIRLAENGWWPSLNAFGDYGLNGLGGRYSDDLDSLGDGSRFYSWTAGAEFSIPLGNRVANAEILKRKLERYKAEYNIRNTKLQIEMEVREAYRQVITDKKRVKTTDTAKNLEKRKLEIEEEKYRLGISTSHDVLEFQADLAEARRRYILAIIDYKKSLAELSRRTGRLLQRYRITIKKLYPGI